MIHYTLLPDKETKSLRREYRTRLFIIFLFFFSCSVGIGILVLIPSYLLSHGQESMALEHAKELQKSKEASGAAQIEKDLQKTKMIADKIIADNDGVVFSDIVERIISHRSKEIYIVSFDFSKEVGTSTQALVVIQGKAVTRESLVKFKEALEADVYFQKIELPISDLAKSKDIGFALRLTTNLGAKPPANK